MTWQQVTQSDRHKMGSETIPREQLKCPLPPLSEDVTMLVFRFAGMMPMICFRDAAVLHILWLDCDHSAYSG
jgi:hypothetical protein